MSLPEDRLEGVEEWPSRTGAIKGTWYRGSGCVRVSLLNLGPFFVAHGFPHRKVRYFRQVIIVQAIDARRILGVPTEDLTVVIFSALPEKPVKQSVDGMAYTSTTSVLSAISGIDKSSLLIL